MHLPIQLLFQWRCYKTLYLHLFQREALLRRFLNNTQYCNDDYGYSDIDNYVPIFRYIPRLSRLMARDDLFHPAYPGLFIPLKNLYNARDWLGWNIGSLESGLKKGCLFRGSCLDSITNDDKEYLVHVLNIGAELDLRGVQEAPLLSPLGKDVKYSIVRLHPYLYGVRKQSAGYRTALRFILKALQEGRNVYVHCTGGADRTGCLFFLMGAALGFSESNLCKDYELTSFSIYGIRKRCHNAANTPFPFSDTIHYIKNTYSGTFQQQVRAWWATENEQEPGITEREWLLLHSLIS